MSAVAGVATNSIAGTTAYPSPADWQAQGRYFTLPDTGGLGRRIFYRDSLHQNTGRGEDTSSDTTTELVPLVLLHGFPTSSWDWYKVWNDLVVQYGRVVAFDMTGFGFSDKPRRDFVYSIHGQADVFEALMRHLGIASCHVLAHNYGTIVAQELMARCQETDSRVVGAADAETTLSPIDIRSVCFLNGGLFPEMHRALLVQKILQSPCGVVLSQINNKRLLKKSLNRIYGPRGIDDAELDGFWDICRVQRGHRILHKLIHYIDDRRRHRDRWVGALLPPPNTITMTAAPSTARTKIPVRLIFGPDDPVAGRHVAQHYVELWNATYNATGSGSSDGSNSNDKPDVVLLDGIGHYPQTDPTKYYSTTATFDNTWDKVCLCV